MRIKPYLPYAGIAVCALLVGLVAGYLSLAQRPPRLQSGPTTTIVLLRPGKPLPVFTLQEADGAPFTQAALAGHWSLLYFGYTRCPDACAATLGDLAKLAVKLHGLPVAEQPHVYFISVDPAYDTPALLKDYLARFDPAFTAVTGTPDQLARLTQSLGVTLSPHASDHTANHPSPVLVIDPQARQTAIYTPPLLPERMVDDYRFILKLNGTQ